MVAKCKVSKGAMMLGARSGEVQFKEKGTDLFSLSSQPALADMLFVAASLLPLVRHPMRRPLLAG